MLTVKRLSLIGVLAGTVAVICGAIPVVFGFYSVRFPVLELTARSIENLRAQAGGESLANCAIASTALSEMASKALSGYVMVVQWQSAFSLVLGVVVLVSSMLILAQSCSKPSNRRDA
jgi:hypothetical protein